jgi:hypothetical protein
MIKLYNERDLDFYNPKPYLTKLMSYLTIEDINGISWYMDDDRYDYLFTWQADASEHMLASKRYRIFIDNVLDVVKPEHMERFIERIVSKVQSFESNLQDNIKYEVDKLQEKNNLLQSLQKDIAERTAKLERLNAILAKAQQIN